MADEGLIDSSPGRAFHQMGGVPKSQCCGSSRSTTAARCGRCPSNGTRKRRRPGCGCSERDKRSALGIGDRVLCRTEQKGDGFIAHPMKKLARSAELALGVVKQEGDALLAVAGRKEGAARTVHQRP